MYLVKHNLIGMADAPESCNEGQNGDDAQGQLVFPLCCGCFLALLYDAIQKSIGLVCSLSIGFDFVFRGASVP